MTLHLNAREYVETKKNGGEFPNILDIIWKLKDVGVSSSFMTPIEALWTHEDGKYTPIMVVDRWDVLESAGILGFKGVEGYNWGFKGLIVPVEMDLPDGVSIKPDNVIFKSEFRPSKLTNEILRVVYWKQPIMTTFRNNIVPPSSPHLEKVLEHLNIPRDILVRK